jgi:uncharacterized repeat protein (TIGR01451 family)
MDSQMVRRALGTAVLAALAIVASFVTAVPARAATFTPTADSYVDAGSPSSNFGAASTVETDGSPIKTAYLKFDVQGVGSTSSATLRVYAETANPAGFEVRSVASNGWAESTITYENAPSVGPVVASSGPLLAGQWYTINVSSLVSGDGEVSLALTSPSSSSTAYASREALNRPELLVPAPDFPTRYDVTRDGTTYTATADVGGTSFTGTLKFAVENAMSHLHGLGGGTIGFGNGVYDLENSWLEVRAVRNITFEGQGMGATVIQNSSGLATDTEPFDSSGSWNIVIRDMEVIASGTPKSTSDVIDFDGGNHNLVERVEITGSRSRGIIFDGKDITSGTPRTADHNIVRDCVISGLPSHGIQLLAASHNRVEGCTITDVGGYGIQIAKSSPTSEQSNKKSTENVLTGNHIENAGLDGVSVTSSDRNEIVQNTILNSSDDAPGTSGVSIFASDSISCDDNVVSDNVATDDQATQTQVYGLDISDGLCRRNVVSGNDFSGNRIAPIRDLGTDTRYPPATPEADLAIAQSDAPDPVTAGTSLTYTLEVSNAGPSDATSVTVSDPLPASAEYVSATASQGSCAYASGTVTCELGAVPSSSNTQVQIVARPEVPGEITNTATVSASEADLDPADNGVSRSTTVNAAPNYPRPGGASPIRVPLVPAFRECLPADQNSNHVAPLELDSCNPRVRESNQLTLGNTGAGQASARIGVQPGNAATPADEADVNIAVSATDVRLLSSGADYTGKVVLAAKLRMTDRANGSIGTLPGTMEDVDFALPVDCVATASTSTGATCSLTATADTLVPGFAIEKRRTIMSVLSVSLLDAGIDGVVTPQVDPLGLGCPPTCGTGDEKVFLGQGVFTP